VAAQHFTVDAAPGVTGYQLSRAVASIPEIKGVAKAVLRALADHYPNIWPSMETIARESGYGERVARMTVKRLAREGWVRVVGDARGGRAISNQYVLDERKILDAGQCAGQRKTLHVMPSLSTDTRHDLPGLAGNPAFYAQNPAPHAEEVIIEENNKQSCANSVRHDSDPSSFSAAKECVQRVWDYYISALDKNPKLLTFTPLRQKKAFSRLREAMVKAGGDMDRAEKLLNLAIDTLAASKFHRGENDTGKAYDSWEKHLFPSQEKLEWWWERAG
jgi:hypothetical protein